MTTSQRRSAEEMLTLRKAIRQCLENNPDMKTNELVKQFSLSYTQARTEHGRILRAMKRDGIEKPITVRVNEQFSAFVSMIRPRLLMGELQAVAAFAKFLETGEIRSIPGNED